MVEHVLCKHEVTGSIPVASTILAPGADAEDVPGEDGTVSGV